MRFPSPETDMQAYIEEIDTCIDQMKNIISEEHAALDKAIQTYSSRVNTRHIRQNEVLFLKVKEALRTLQNVKDESVVLIELVESLRNLKEVNKMLLFALNQSDLTLVSLAAFVGPVCNVCLGQLKYIRSRYESSLYSMRKMITNIWMDRDISQAMRLILFVNHLLFDRFLKVFEVAEILYADLSLNAQLRKTEDVQQYVVLRMISKRLPSIEEQRIIRTLFPQWHSLTTANE